MEISSVIRKMITVTAAVFAVTGSLLAQSGLTSLQVIPDDAVAGVSSIHTITFTAANAIPSDGRIVIVYPSGFDVSGVSIASSSTINGSLTVTKSGNTITLIRSGGTATATGMDHSLKLANVRNASVSTTYTIIVQTRTVGAALIDGGTYDQYEIVPAAFDNFSLSYIPSPQTAGVPVTATVTARDTYGNTISDYNAETTLTDLTGTASPSRITFTGGVWSGELTITGAMSSNQVTATGAGKSSSSNQFTVLPAAADHFSIAHIESPLTAGVNTSITITAEDEFGNTATGFSGIAFLSDDTGTLWPSTSGSFTQGIRVENIMITQAAQDITVSVTDGSNHSGRSNSFNVVHGDLVNFSLANISDQASGTPFTITVTASDLYGNTIKSFSGTGNTVGISHTGSGAIVPTVSGEFTNGRWTGNVIVSQTQINDRIIVQRTGGTQTGQSNQFNVSASSVDHFLISSIGGNQTAGVPFSVTITAKDAADNTIDSFNGSANLFDETGTNTPSQFSFENGVWSGNVVITGSREDNTLTVSSLGKSNSSNEFDVYADEVDSFIIDQIATPQMAGAAFELQMRAVDQFGNTATNFNDRVSISDGTGTLLPSSSGFFSNGTRTENTAITRTGSDVRITIIDGSGHYGQSNYFNVIGDSVDHFIVTVSGSQIAGDPFTIQVTARDQYDNQATSFTGTVDLSDLTGSIQPTRSSSFTAGQWTGNITIDQEVTDNIVTVTRTGGDETGSSQTFDLVEAPGIRILQSSASQQNVTAGQDQDWQIRFAVANLSANYATLDSVRLKFFRYGQLQDDYVLDIEPGFVSSGNDLISGNSTDTILVTVDRSGLSSGAVFIQGNVYCLDSNTGRTVHASGETGITVQDSAHLDIYRLEVSRQEVTRGQDTVWTVTAILQNTGEAAILLNSAQIAGALQFSIGTGWSYEPPASLSGGGWELAGGEMDSAVFRITHTGENASGQCMINAEFTGIERNTGRTLSDDTGDYGAVSVLIEQEARLQVIGVRSLAPNNLLVNTNQDYYIRVKVRNTGGDAAENLKVSLQTSGYSIFPQSANGSLAELKSGETDSVDILIRAASTPADAERFTAHAEGYAQNTGQLFLSAASAFDYTDITVQRPAKLIIPRLVLSDAELVAGQVDPWTIKAVTHNAGDADLLLEPQNTDVRFFSNGLRQYDYIIQAPEQLSGGGLMLHGGGTDTLTYRVISTGRLGGTINVHTVIQGVDQNSGARPDTTGYSQISVQSETAFRIISTSTVTRNRTEAGNGIVNTGQHFQVKAVIENGLGETVRDIRVGLQGSGASVITQSPLTIQRLLPSRRDSVFFPVTAAGSENVEGEVFTASINAAVLENSGQPAPLGDPLDRTASAVIQEQAELEIGLEQSNSNGRYSANQLFTLSAFLKNHGSAKADDSGVLRITLPDNYVLENGSSQTRALAADSTVTWNIRAPMEEHAAPRTIEVEFATVPLDVNTGEPAQTTDNVSRIDVQTVAAELSASLSIAAPQGARDGVLSTGQFFVVRAFIQWKNVEQIAAQLILPAGYSTSDNLVKSVISPEVYWQVKAPVNAASPRALKLDISGYDAFQPDKLVSGIQEQLGVTAVARADLALSLATSDNSVSLGQEFVVSATVTNNGTAGTSGITQVSLDELPAGYSTADPLTRTLSAGGCSWTVKAPSSPTREAVNIVARITTVPDDENINEPAFVSTGTDKAALTTVGAWLAIGTIDAPDTLSGIVLPGQNNVWLGAMSFSNRGEAGANGIVIKHIKFDVEDPAGGALQPAAALQSLSLVGMRKTGGGLVPDPDVRYGSLSSATFPAENPLTLNITSQLRIMAGDTGFVALLGTISQADSVSDFALTIKDQTYISAKDEYSPEIDIEVKDVTGADFRDYRSFRKQIMSGKDMEQDRPYLITCPNPFGQSGSEYTTFVYYLDETTDVTLTIVTLTGETVWTADFAAGEPETLAGLHSLGSNSLTWDGNNGAGYPVLNGVYVAFLQTGNGRSVSTKIAVMR